MEFVYCLHIVFAIGKHTKLFRWRGILWENFLRRSRNSFLNMKNDQKLDKKKFFFVFFTDDMGQH